MANHVARRGRREVYAGVCWVNLREGDLLEEPGVLWEDNTEMDVQEVGWEGMDWMYLAQDRNS